MSDNRREKIPFYPYVFLILAFAMLLAAGGFYINYPEQLNAVYCLLGTCLVFAIAAIIGRPSIIKELFFNKKTVLWVNDIILVLLVIGIGVLLSHIAFRHNFRFDLTKNKNYSLSELTIKTIRELDKKVTIYGFFSKGSLIDVYMTDLFNEYKRHNEKLSWMIVDPQIDPVTTKRLNVTAMNTIVVECEANRQNILPSDLFIRSAEPTANELNTTPLFTGEQVITSAINNVIHGDKTVICVITGHEEPSIYKYGQSDIGGLNQLLTSENLEVVEKSLLNDDIDPRANVVLVISPKIDYMPPEIEKLKRYVENKKGNIIFAFDPSPNLKNLNDFVFKEYAVSTNYDIVVDPRGISQKYWTLCPVLTKHDISAPLINKNLIGLMFHCCSLTKEARPDVNHTVLMKSIDYSWAKRGLESAKYIDVQLNKSVDAMGPFDLAVIAQKTNTASGSKAIIIGDADFITNGMISYSGNRDLIINAINWLAGNHKLLSIRPRTLEIPRIMFSGNDSSKIFTLCVIAVPLFIILIGGMVFLYRRRVR